MRAEPVVWEDEMRVARKRARILPITKPAEVSVEVWLSAYRLLFPDSRTLTTQKHDARMLRPFRREHGHLRMWDDPDAPRGTTVTPMLAQAWALDHPEHVRWLEHAWKKAVLMRIAPLNVWALVEVPRSNRERVRPPTAQEFAGILAGSRAHADPWFAQLADMAEVAAYTGARVGGLCGLRREHVDLPGRRMVVTEKGAKTRTVVLTAPAAEAMGRALVARTTFCDCQLRALDDDGMCSCGRPRDFRWANRLRAQPYSGGGRRNPQQFVFRSRTGVPLTPLKVSKEWARIRGGFPFGFHSLKHYAATWLAAQGVDELDIAVQLGHTDTSGRPYARLVRRVYDHRDSGEALQRLQAVTG